MQNEKNAVSKIILLKAAEEQLLKWVKFKQLTVAESWNKVKNT